VLTHLLCWPQAKIWLDAMCIYFHNAYTRDAFSYTCLTDGRLPWKGFFTSGPPKFEGGRVWNVLVEAVDWLLTRKYIIRTSWDRQRVAFHRVDGQPGDDNEDGVRFNKVDEAIGSPLFWGVLQLLSAFASFLGIVSAWVQSCSCHPTALCQALEIMPAKLTCPMRGRRGSELACGQLSPFLTQLADTTSAHLQANLDGASPVQRASVLADFDVGKAFLLAEFTLRTQCWTQLPLKLICLGHWDLAVVRQHLGQCLVLYDNLPGGTHHPWTEQLLHPASPLRDMCELLIAGDTTFDECDDLAKHRARAQFLPTLEVSIERKHAQLHHGIRLSPRHGGAFASMMLRKGELIRGLDENAEELHTELAALLRAYSSPRSCIIALGLQSHPVFAPHRINGELSRDLPHTLAVKVVYRCDVETQFMELPDVHPPDEHDDDEQVAPAVPLGARAGLPAAVPLAPGDIAHQNADDLG
jgi:hypothetical protein